MGRSAKKEKSPSSSPKKTKKAAGKKTTEKKTKAKKDPNAPKKGLSGYMFYSNERRVSLKKEQPELAFGDITKTIAGEWNEMSDAAKKPYQEKAEQDKVRYQKELAAYEATKK